MSGDGATGRQRNEPAKKCSRGRSGAPVKFGCGGGWQPGRSRASSGDQPLLPDSPPRLFGPFGSSSLFVFRRGARTAKPHTLVPAPGSFTNVCDFPIANLYSAPLQVIEQQTVITSRLFEYLNPEQPE